MSDKPLYMLEKTPYNFGATMANLTQLIQAKKFLAYAKTLLANFFKKTVTAGPGKSSTHSLPIEWSQFLTQKVSDDFADLSKKLNMKVKLRTRRGDEHALVLTMSPPYDQDEIKPSFIFNAFRDKLLKDPKWTNPETGLFSKLGIDPAAFEAPATTSNALAIPFTLSPEAAKAALPAFKASMRDIYNYFAKYAAAGDKFPELSPEEEATEDPADKRAPKDSKAPLDTESVEYEMYRRKHNKKPKENEVPPDTAILAKLRDLAITVFKAVTRAKNAEERLKLYDDWTAVVKHAMSTVTDAAQLAAMQEHYEATTLELENTMSALDATEEQAQDAYMRDKEVVEKLKDRKGAAPSDEVGAPKNMQFVKVFKNNPQQFETNMRALPSPLVARHLSDLTEWIDTLADYIKTSAAPDPKHIGLLALLKDVKLPLVKIVNEKLVERRKASEEFTQKSEQVERIVDMPVQAPEPEKAPEKAPEMSPPKAPDAAPAPKGPAKQLSLF